MIAVVKLLFKYQTKSWFSFLLCFILPFIFLIFSIAFSNTIQQPSSSNGVFLALPGVIISIGPTIGMINLTLILTDFKQTLFFKRLKAMPLKMSEFFYSLICYHLLIIFIISLELFGVSAAIYHKQIHFNWINWAWLFFTIIINSITSCLIGFIFNIFIEDFKLNLIVAIVFFLLTVFLSGCYLPLFVIKTSSILKYLALIIPGTYASSLMIYSWYHFTPTYNGKELISYKDYGIFTNYLIPLIISLIIIVILLNFILFQKSIKTLPYKIKRHWQEKINVKRWKKSN